MRSEQLAPSFTWVTILILTFFLEALEFGSVLEIQRDNLNLNFGKASHSDFWNFLIWKINVINLLDELSTHSSTVVLPLFLFWVKVILAAEDVLVALLLKRKFFCFSFSFCLFFLLWEKEKKREEWEGREPSELLLSRHKMGSLSSFCWVLLHEQLKKGKTTEIQDLNFPSFLSFQRLDIMVKWLQTATRKRTSEQQACRYVGLVFCPVCLVIFSFCRICLLTNIHSTRCSRQKNCDSLGAFSLFYRI